MSGLMVFEDAVSGEALVGVAAAARHGALVPVPERVEIGHDVFGMHCAVALVPLELGSPDGTVRHLEPGDLLSADEVEHAGNGFHVLVRAGKVARLPVDRGVVALALLAGRR